jgi:hypothetical protein
MSENPPCELSEKLRKHTQCERAKMLPVFLWTEHEFLIRIPQRHFINAKYHGNLLSVFRSLLQPSLDQNAAAPESAAP